MNFPLALSPPPPLPRGDLYRHTTRPKYNHSYYKLCVRCPHRFFGHCHKKKIWLWVNVVAVLTLLGRNLSYHQSIVTYVHEDLIVTSHWIQEESNPNIEARLPPAPWPVESNGCYAEMGTRPYCQFHNLLIDISRVESASIGGEPLVVMNDGTSNNINNGTRQVLGQTENDEYLTYRTGAFQLFSDRNTTFPTKKFGWKFYYVNDVLQSLQIVDVNPNAPLHWNCTRHFPGATLFIQRYEYVNLYHSVTDWWNTWTVHRSLRQNELANVAVVFLDAHPMGNLDPVWTTLFGTSVHLRRLDDGNPTEQTAHLCFDRAMLVPPGYINPLWPRFPPTRQTYEMMPQFVDFVLDKLNLTHVHKIPGTVVMIDRKPYLAHARSQFVDDRTLNNLPEIANVLLQNITNVTSVRILQLHNMTFREQVKAVREAEVLVGVHGAGLTHLMFMDNETHVVEFQIGGDQDFFGHLASCKSGQVTLHKLPTVSGRISERILHNYLLPTFAKIYGLPVPVTATRIRVFGRGQTT